MSDVVLVLAQTLLLVAVAPLWPGLVLNLRARLQMRQGPSPLQGYRDLATLALKETVVSADASPLARVLPAVILGCALAAASWTPVLAARDALGFVGDLVVTVALLAALRMLLALLALECGTAFAGLAASRHLMLSALAEPALLLAGFTLALGAGSTDLGALSAGVVATRDAWLSPSHLLALTAMAMVVLSESGRGPVDNPVTHLELTMIHEGLTLDLSGRHRWLVEWAARVRALVLLTLFVNLFMPWGIAIEPTPLALAGALAAWLAKLMLLAVTVAVIESITARMRLYRVPEFLGLAFLLALLALASDAMLR